MIPSMTCWRFFIPHHAAVGLMYEDLYHFVSLGVSLEIRSAVETLPVRVSDNT